MDNDTSLVGLLNAVNITVGLAVCLPGCEKWQGTKFLDSQINLGYFNFALYQCHKMLVKECMDVVLSLLIPERNS